MIRRLIEKQVSDGLARQAAVCLSGPRQSGKTTLAMKIAKSRPSTYLDLESSADRNKLSEPAAFFESHRDELVILDEVQRVPDLFEELRGVIDRGRRGGFGNGRFLLLGSASRDLLRQSGESLAGRVAYLELGPLGMPEVPRTDRDRLWVRGGFPPSFLAESDDASFAWRRDFIATYLERDIPQLGPRIPAETLRRFWTMLCHEQGGLLNAARLAAGLGVAGSTVARYLDLMVDLLLVRRLSPWTGNTGKRMVKSPKVFVRDSGILHALLGLTNFDNLLGHPIVGPSWEGFVIESILNLDSFPNEATFYRTGAGAEVDLILGGAGLPVWAIEIKRTMTPKVSRGFRSAVEDIRPDRSFLVYPGESGYPLGAGVEAIGATEMNELVAGRLSERA